MTNMSSYLARGPAGQTVRVALAAIALAGLGAFFVHSPAPARASVSSALQIAEHTLASATALEDESPYQLIDPVGPGGITQKQAVGEVTSSTMQGGLYNDSGRYSGGYGQQYFVPAGQTAPRGSGNWVPHGGAPR
jgi:hypothetical protein